MRCIAQIVADMSAAAQQAARLPALNLLSLILQQQGACQNLEGLQQVTVPLLLSPAWIVHKELIALSEPDRSSALTSLVLHLVSYLRHTVPDLRGQWGRPTALRVLQASTVCPTCRSSSSSLCRAFAGSWNMQVLSLPRHLQRQLF